MRLLLKPKKYGNLLLKLNIDVSFSMNLAWCFGNTAVTGVNKLNYGVYKIFFENAFHYKKFLRNVSAQAVKGLDIKQTCPV